MALTIDAAAVVHNASVIRSRVDAAGLKPRAMFKRAYALPALIEATLRGGIDSFYASSPRAARSVSNISNRDCGLCGPEVAFLSRTRRSISDLLCATAVVAGTALRMPSIGHVWLAAMTSDGRDGIDLDRLADVMAQLLDIPGADGRIGIALNWGCLGGRPDTEEIALFAASLRILADHRGGMLPVSLGGSTLLPLLGTIALPGSNEVRIGEALVAGTIPGGGEVELGLRRPFSLAARIVDVQTRGGMPHIVVNRGNTVIDVRDVVVPGLAARPVAAASEVALFALSRDTPPPAIGASIELALGYQSMLRALLNRTVRRHIRSA